MASSKCSISDCKRDFDTRCGHCESNFCSKHYIEHVKLANEELTPVADRLNGIMDNLQQRIPLEEALQRLEQHRKNAHQEIDRIYDEKRQELQKTIECELDEQMKKLQDIRQQVKELISEGDASCKQIQQVRVAIDECQKRYKDFGGVDSIRMKLKPIETMIHIAYEGRFDGGALLNTEHQIKLNEFYGKADKKWVLLYKATRDGFEGVDFHRCCDNQGPTMTVIQSKSGGYLFGGYTSASWKSTGWYVEDNNGPFLFTLVNPHGIVPTKYDIKNQKHAIFDNNGCGPIFGGGHDICVYDNSQTRADNYANFPMTYVDTTGQRNATFTGDKQFQTSDIEVYRPVTI